MIKIIQSPWIATVLGALLYWGVTVAVWPPNKLDTNAAQHAKPKPAAPSWTFHNPDLVSLVEELKKEREHLTEKERQLNELSLRLNSERQELNQATQLIYNLQVEFDRNVTRVEEQESANLKKLARMYASMAPENAVQILKQMEDPALVKVLSLMKDSEAAPILESMGKQGESEAKHAAVITERLRLAIAKPSNQPQGGR